VATVVVPSGDPTGEPVSPELALVDPSLAERLREALPDAPVRVVPPPSRFGTAEPIPQLVSVVEPADGTEVVPDSPLTTHATDPVVLRLVPRATPDEDDVRLVPRATPDEDDAVAEDVTAPEPVSLDPAPDLVLPEPEPGPEPESEPAAPVVVSPEPVVEPEAPRAVPEPPPVPEPDFPAVPVPAPVAEPERDAVHVEAAEPLQSSTAALGGARPPLVLPRPRRRRWRLRIYLALVVVAAGSLVAVGVVAERGERAIAEANEQRSAAPVIEPPAETGAPSAEPPAGQPSSESATPPEPEGSGAPRASATPKATPPASQSAPPRRFAWAPVENAVAYHVELFRGADRILARETTKPVLELGQSWRHEGRLVRLTPGTYRWYVWPVTSSGRATQAVVQARLTVP
jgi:hypothetical protein